MAYDEKLAGRVRVLLAGRRDVIERQMFGGLTFMVGEHMCGGVQGDTLILRLGTEGAAEAFASGRADPWISPAAPWPDSSPSTAGPSAAQRWLSGSGQAVAWADSVPPKQRRRRT
jgi:hypothetical protein